MTDVDNSHGGKDLTLPGIDPFLAYGSGGSALSGGTALLLYTKGEYLAGQDKVFIPLGTKMVVNVGGVRTGWRKWIDNKIADEDMQLLVERPRIPARSHYDATDTREWQGGSRDPWQETIVFDVTDGQGETYSMPLSGVGGIRAGKKLIADYGLGRRSRAGQVPLVELGSDSYPHPKFGKTHFPLLPIVGWVDEESLEPVEDVGGSDIPFDPPPAKIAAAAASVEVPTEKPVQPAPDTKKPRAPRF